jgi:aminoglycoside 6'-N-acetyltransferase
MQTLTGDLCVLRPLRLQDIGRLAEIQSEPNVTRWWGPPEPDHLKGKLDPAAGEVALGVEVDGELVGLIEFHEETTPEFRHAGIDLFLCDAAQGRGIGTDAVTTLVSYLVSELGHHRITIDPGLDNHAAIRCYEKVGFLPVGVMRQYWRSPEGIWRDGLLMELLADDRSDGR